MAADRDFYLTGGTAASRGYLHHRFSDDLEFFVNDDDRFGLWAQRLVQALVSASEWTVAVGQQEQRFVRLTVTERDVVLKIEMVNDVPAHVGPLKRDPVLGLLRQRREHPGQQTDCGRRSPGTSGSGRHLGLLRSTGLVL